MFCGMLEVNPKSDQFDNYFGMAKMLRPELEKIDGFVDNARFSSLTRPGWLLSLSSWRDEKGVGELERRGQPPQSDASCA